MIRQVREPIVYFVCNANKLLVKIGTTDRDRLPKRLREMQTGNPEELYLLGWLAGGDLLEQRLHRQFAADRYRGEWFYLTLTVAKLLDAEGSERMYWDLERRVQEEQERRRDRLKPAKPSMRVMVAKMWFHPDECIIGTPASWQLR